MRTFHYTLCTLSLAGYIIFGRASAAMCSPLDDIVGQLRNREESKGVSEREIEETPSVIKENMRAALPEVLWNPAHSNTDKLDKHYSPHLRDIGDGVQRSAHVHIRSQAGEFSGVTEDACPASKDWSHPEHETNACCGTDTSRYAALREDHNFKTCCVRRGEEQLSEEEIACRHPDGTGWAGLFEFYFPTQILEWGRSDGTSLIVDKESIDAAFQESKPISKAQSAPEVDDITLRVNLAAMDQKHREALAKDLCMHPMQFMKLMDPDPHEDPYQRNPEGQGTPGEKMLKAIPLWSTYSKFGATLVTDPLESLKLANFDAASYSYIGGTKGRATDLALGYERGFSRDAQYCQSLADGNIRVDSDGLSDAVDVYGKGISRESKEINTGYSCVDAGSGRMSMSPVTKGGADQGRELSAARAMAFMIAAGVYAPAMADPQTRTSYYKRFEPLPYFKFKGKPFVGSVGANELGLQCRTVKGEMYSKATPRGDRLYTGSSGVGGNHAAPMRIFASCPKGWTRWRGPHSELACGEEKLW
jgi:hypothetical protein